MSVEVKQPVLAYVEAFNRGDVEAVCRNFAPAALVQGVLGWGPIDKVRAIWSEIMRSFAMQLQVDSIIAEGEIVAVRYTERGAFVADFRGAKSTGKPYEVVAMEWFEVRAGLIQRRWGARDSASIYRQIGLASTS